MQQLNERMKARGQGGFTLIELLVVIAILGILAGVVVFAVGNLTDDAEQNACQIEVRTVKTAVAAYRTEEGEYPIAVADLDPYLEDAASAVVANADPLGDNAAQLGAAVADEPTYNTCPAP